MLEKFKKLNEEWVKAQALPYKDRPKFNYDKATLEKLIPIFSQQKLVRKGVNGLVSASATIKAIEDPQVVDALKFVFNVSRSDLVFSMQEDSKLGTLTPIFMWAHKLYHDVDYARWDRTDKQVRFMLGRILAPILDVKVKPEFDVSKERALGLTCKSGANMGKMVALTNHRMNKEALPTIPKIARYMYLQTWLANASLRDEESMILDPLDWGRIPDALDEKVEIKRKNEPKKKKENDFWI